MSIADQLLLLSNTKLSIKQAIEDQGVSVGAVPFSDYPQKISEISGGSPQPSGWLRPQDWLTLPSVAPGDKIFVGLHAVYEDANFVAVSAEGAYTVNWGDGVIENFASGAIAQHEYNYATYDPSGATLCSRGYKQVLVEITPQSENLLTLISLSPVAASYTSGWLDVVIASEALSVVTVGSSPNITFHRLLEQFQIVGEAYITDFSYAFNARFALQSVEIPNIKGLVSTASMFSSCRSLQVVPLFDTSAVTNMSSMFSGCSSLQVVPLFDTSAVTNMSSMFSICYSLQVVPAFDTSAVTSMSGMFSSCGSLQAVPAFDTSAVTNMLGMFSSCGSLQAVPAFDTSAVTNMSSMFTNCGALQAVPLFDTSAVTNMSSMFGGCSSLQVVPAFDTSAVTSMSGMFSSCNSLQAVPAFATSAVTNMSSMFSGCTSLQAVPAFDTSAVTSMSNMSNMFGSCPSISRIEMFGMRVSFSVANCKLSALKLNEIYSNLATVSGQTLTVTGNFGTSGDDPSIATAKGWTVTG